MSWLPWIVHLSYLLSFCLHTHLPACLPACHITLLCLQLCPAHCLPFPSAQPCLIRLKSPNSLLALSLDLPLSLPSQSLLSNKPLFYPPSPESAFGFTLFDQDNYTYGTNDWAKKVRKLTKFKNNIFSQIFNIDSLPSLHISWDYWNVNIKNSPKKYTELHGLTWPFLKDMFLQSFMFHVQFNPE